MPEDSDKCTPLSLRVALKRNATQKIEFGLAKSCRDVGGRFESVWVIHFALLEKEGEEFTPKISVDININDEAPDKTKKAEDTEKAGLSDRQTLFIMGPVARAADKAIEQPGGDELQALFASLNPSKLQDVTDKDLEVLDRAAAERDDNVRKLRTRVITVLAVQ
jgi:hypothetical protein